jgi:hypothetical protein
VVKLNYSQIICKLIGQIIVLNTIDTGQTCKIQIIHIVNIFKVIIDKYGVNIRYLKIIIHTAMSKIIT